MNNRGKWARQSATLDGLLERTMPEPNSGCLFWMGTVNQFGYGRVTVAGRRTVAHRAVYEMACGPVSPGLELDHLCRVRSCVNPAHLEPVTKRVNGLRGLAGVKSGAMQRAKTHCPEGHPYSGANLFLRSSGHRECRICMRARNRSAAA